MSLSDKIAALPKGLTCACGECDLSHIKTRHVKEFIKELKKEIQLNSKSNKHFSKLGDPTTQQVYDFINQAQNDMIDKLAGEKLI